MINRSVDQVHYKETVPFGAEILRAEGLSGPRLRGRVAGGAGRRGGRPLRPDRRRAQRVRADALRPLRQDAAARSSGTASRSTIRNEADAIRRGIALVPESRRDQGLCLNLGVGLNVNLPIFDRLTRGIAAQPAAPRRAAADRQIQDMQIKTASRDANASSLSGGNQQKIVVGKWLNHGAKLFIFDEPTVGVDVGTKVEIYKIFARLLKDGRRHHPDLVLPARGLRPLRHAARVPPRPAGRQPCRRRRPTRKPS